MRIDVAWIAALLFVRGDIAVEQTQCVVRANLPVGVENQGGYAFDYQSGKGDICRVYRLRNMPGRLQTPVLWKDRREVFMDLSLPECAAKSACQWDTVVRISADSSRVGKSTLSYGLNRDEFTDDPDAYRSELVSKPTRLPPLITIFGGVVPDGRRNPHRIAIQLSSYAFAKGAEPYTLRYEIEITGMSEAMRLLRPATARDSGSGLGLIWHAAASDSFFRYLERNRLTDLLPGGDKSKVIFEIQATEIEVEEFQLLEVLAGGDVIAATTAPAYRPAFRLGPAGLSPPPGVPHWERPQPRQN